MSLRFLQLPLSAFHVTRHGDKGCVLPRNSSRNFGFEHRKFLRTAACASSPISGSPAGHPEQWLEEKKPGKKIAGVDQEDLLDPRLLADPDSCFCEFEGIKLHYKVCDAAGSQARSLSEDRTAPQLSEQINKLGFPMILLHGFGASVFSWHQVMKPLAQNTGTKVLGFDRPAFGLSSREGRSSSFKKDTAVNPYSMAFSVLATLYLIHFLGGQKAILVGHSAGSLVALNSYFEAPERVAALILVAPALLAPLIILRNVEGQDPQRDNNMTLFKMFSNFWKSILHAIMQLVKGMGNMLGSLYKRLVSFILRSSFGVVVVRMVIDKFGVAAIRNAWYDSSKVTDDVLNGYTKPLRTKGWDRALVEYTAALLTDSGSESKPPLAERLREISCPVLIITGDNDRLVPSWNSKRLWKAIPGSHLKVIEHCGHLPQEERPEVFVEAVLKFLLVAFADLKGQPVPAGP